MNQKPKGIILDLDGTVCLGDHAIPGSPEAIAALRARGISIVFVSNTTDTREEYAQRLENLDIPVTPEEIIQTPVVLRHYLETEHPRATLYVIGIPSLKQELEPFFAFSEDPKEIDIVIASLDTELNFAMLTTAFHALRNGARFVATNIDPTAPFAEGELPDAAGVISFLEATTGRKLEVNIGKPSPFMLNAALDHLDLPPQATLLVGDRLETDIVMAKDAGIPSVLVLSGVTRRHELAQAAIQPTFVLPNLAGLPALLDTLDGAGGAA